MILQAGMAHQRKLVRHAIVNLLTNATAAGPRVSASRVDPHKKTGLPAIVVYTPDEEVEPDAALTAPRELLRTVRVAIAGFVADTDALPMDDAMDDLAEQIEAVMDADRYLGSEAGDSILQRTDMQYREPDGRSDPLVGIVTLTYSVTYRTSPAAANLDDFIRAGVTHKLVGGVSDTVPASDLVTVQESP